MKTFLRAALVLSLALLTTLSASRIAAADAVDFLAAFSGDWRGSGQARENPKADLSAVRCSLSASFAGNALTTSGKCGTTQGTRSLNGKMTASGNSISGNLFSQLDQGQLVSESSQLQGSTLTTQATFRDINGKLVRLRTSLRKPSGGKFTVNGQLYDDAAQKWVESANITFTTK